MDIDEGRKSAKIRPSQGFRPTPYSRASAFSPFSALSAPILYPFCTSRLAGEEKPSVPKKRVRLTYAPGADVLPVFSPDGKKIMWTSTRDGKRPGGQLYIADFVPPKD
jgi:hypothetical protein